MSSHVVLKSKVYAAKTSYGENSDLLEKKSYFARDRGREV